MRIDDEIREAFIKSYKRHRSVFAVAKEFGCGATTVHRHLRRAGVELDGLVRYQKRSRKLSDAQSKTVIKRYQSGSSLNELARQYDVTTWVIVDRLKAAGVQRRRRGNRKTEPTKAYRKRVAARSTKNLAVKKRSEKCWA